MYDYSYEVTTDALGAGLAIAGTFFIIMYMVGLAIGIFSIICNWRVYKKAGKEGWATLIPVYNIIVLLEIVELPLWYIALFFVPFVNIYAVIKIYIELAKKFGKSGAFAVGLILLNPIFMAILAFSKDAKYVGNVSSQQTQQQAQNFSQQPVETPVQNIQTESVSTPLFCTNCGNRLVPGAKFCTNCGKQL